MKMNYMKMNNNSTLDENHIYYDLKIKNTFNNSNDNIKRDPAGNIPFNVKDETSVILSKQNEYKMAIHSFQLNIDIPLIIYPIIEGINQTDINKSIYSITITHNNVDYQEYIMFEAEIDTNINKEVIPLPPSQNSGLQDFSTGYYYIYSYYSWCKMMNDTFNKIIARINFDNPGLFPNAPQMVYDKEVFTFIYPKEIYSTNSQIYFNQSLALDIGGFPFKLIKFNNVNNKHNLLLIPPINDPMAFSYLNPNSNVPEPTPSYYRLSQEYDVRFRFNGVSQLVLTSDYLAIRKEYYPDTSNPNNTFISAGYQQFNTPSLPIIASFSLIDEGGSSWVQTQDYQPAFYKWIDLLGSQPLKEIDIKVYLQLKRGSLIQANIPLDSMSIIKFVFKKKGDTD